MNKYPIFKTINSSSEYIYIYILISLFLTYSLFHFPKTKEFTSPLKIFKANLFLFDVLLRILKSPSFTVNFCFGDIYHAINMCYSHQTDKNADNAYLWITEYTYEFSQNGVLFLSMPSFYHFARNHIIPPLI